MNCKLSQVYNYYQNNIACSLRLSLSNGGLTGLIMDAYGIELGGSFGLDWFLDNDMSYFVELKEQNDA